jgi:hypothetical protein
MADIGDDIRRCHGALCILASQLLKEFRLVSEHEQLIILHVSHIMNANSAACAFTQIGNLPASVWPLMRIESAVIDRADRVRQRLSRNSVQIDHVELFLLVLRSIMRRGAGRLRMAKFSLKFSWF